MKPEWSISVILNEGFVLESCLSTCEVLMYDSLYGFVAEIDIIYLEEIRVSHK